MLSEKAKKMITKRVRKALKKHSVGDLRSELTDLFEYIFRYLALIESTGDSLEDEHYD